MTPTLLLFLIKQCVVNGVRSVPRRLTHKWQEIGCLRTDSIPSTNKQKVATSPDSVLSYGFTYKTELVHEVCTKWSLYRGVISLDFRSIYFSNLRRRTFPFLFGRRTGTSLQETIYRRRSTNLLSAFLTVLTTL